VKHFARLVTILVLLTATCASGASVAEGNVNHSVVPAKNPAQFAGQPPEGTHWSTHTSDRLVLSIRLLGASPKSSGDAWNVRNVYADGRMVWQRWTHSGDPIAIPQGARMVDTGYVQQRLTPGGVHLLRSMILSTGLFAHTLRLTVGKHRVSFLGRVRRGDRMVTVAGYTEASWNAHLTKATPAQARRLARIEALFADPAASLPSAAWADRQVRAFLPSHSMVAFDRSAPDMSKLPPPLREVLGVHKRLLRHGCQVMTTGEARALLQGLVDAGIPARENRASIIDFGLAGFRHIPSDLHFSPALPAESC
jgi:hypothetical protein